MSLYLKYRPKTLEEVRGNKETVEALNKMLSDTSKCPHSFLFTGPSGCGKTTLGRIVANRLGCKGNDYREVDSADFRGIDTIREIRKQAQYRPLEGTCMVWLIDECHKLTNDAQNALLKILEDTPKHVYFILCTTDPQKLIETVKGRCSTFQVKLLDEIPMTKLLRVVTKAEGETLDAEVFEQIVQDSMGHARNALQILEQVLNVSPEKRLEIAKKSAEQQSQTIELCRALLNPKGGWKSVATILEGLKSQDPENIRRAVLGYCQAILLKADNVQAGIIMEQFLEPTYNSGFPQIVFASYSAIKS